MRDLNATENDYPTFANLMREQNVNKKYDEYWLKECELNPSTQNCLEY